MNAHKQILKIGIDLDGTISEYPAFFKLFTKAAVDAGGIIYIITDRAPGTEAFVRAELESYGLTWHVLKITSEKSSYILHEGISVLFEDVDDYFVDLPPEVAVFKVRQQYNFDFVNKRWRLGH